MLSIKSLKGVNAVKSKGIDNTQNSSNPNKVYTLKEKLLLSASAVLVFFMYSDTEEKDNFDDFIDEYPDNFKELTKESLLHIGDGRSGLYKYKENYALVANFDGLSSLKKEDIELYESMIGFKLDDIDIKLGQPMYYSSVSDSRNAALNNRSNAIDIVYSPEYHSEWLKIKNIDENKLNYLSKEERINKLVALHEVSHFMINDSLINAYSGDYGDIRILEFGADSLSVNLWASINNLSLNDYNRLVNDLIFMRENSCAIQADRNHYTVKALSIMQRAFTQEPNLFDKMKSLSIEDLQEVVFLFINNLNPSHHEIGKGKKDFSNKIKSDLSSRSGRVLVVSKPMPIIGEKCNETIFSESYSKQLGEFEQEPSDSKREDMIESFVNESSRISVLYDAKNISETDVDFFLDILKKR